MTEPVPCEQCNGTGRVYRYRINDLRYPVKCTGCGGSGIARASTRFLRKG